MILYVNISRCEFSYRVRNLRGWFFHTSRVKHPGMSWFEGESSSNQLHLIHSVIKERRIFNRFALLRDIQPQVASKRGRGKTLRWKLTNTSRLEFLNIEKNLQTRLHPYTLKIPAIGICPTRLDPRQELCDQVGRVASYNGSASLYQNSSQVNENFSCLSDLYPINPLSGGKAVSWNFANNLGLYLAKQEIHIVYKCSW